MIHIRKSDDRGHADHGWLEARHTFSFADYVDPEHMRFGDLRVINEDRIAPAAGFPTHPHRDMEIVTFVIEGELEHRDSMGHGSIIRPGEIQRMSAGTGITHSEFNRSGTQSLHLLQIWIETERPGISPDYEQKNYLPFRQHGTMTLIASRGGKGDSVHINQDINLYNAALKSGETLQVSLMPGRRAWIQVINGQFDIEGQIARDGDGVAITDLERFDISATRDGEFLLFDLREDNLR